jgi:hypothetical protein
VAIGAGEAILDMRCRRIFSFFQLFRETIGAMAAGTDCRDFLRFVEFVERSAISVEVPLPKFEFDARFSLFRRPAVSTAQHRHHRYGNRKWRELAPMKDGPHAFLILAGIVENRLL